jgi:hypothetical protein
MIEVQVSDTFKQTFINSGATASPIIASIISGSESVVSSGAGVDSGNGHYYRMTSVDTPGFYVSQWDATISGNAYKRKLRFKAIMNEVD